MGIGQYALYRLRFILAGDLTDVWEDFGGLTAQINHLATVIDLSITDHAGIAITYDHRIHVLIQKAALKRSTNTDYFSLLSSLHAETKAAVVRDFETQTEVIKKEREKEKMAKEKEKGAKQRDKKAAWEKRKADGGKGDAAGHPRWQKPWTRDDWAAWNKKKKEKNESDSAGEDKKTDEKLKKKKESK